MFRFQGVRADRADRNTWAPSLKRTVYMMDISRETVRRRGKERQSHRDTYPRYRDKEKRDRETEDREIERQKDSEAKRQREYGSTCSFSVLSKCLQCSGSCHFSYLTAKKIVFHSRVSRSRLVAAVLTIANCNRVRIP